MIHVLLLVSLMHLRVIGKKLKNIEVHEIEVNNKLIDNN